MHAWHDDECTAAGVIDPAPRADYHGGTEIVSETVKALLHC